MILAKNVKAMVRSLDNDFYDIFPGIWLDYVLRKSFDQMKENGRRLKRYKELLANKPAQAKCLPNHVGQVVWGIRLNVNSNKTEFMCFKQDCIVST